jgi:hypothetical protein
MLLPAAPSIAQTTNDPSAGSPPGAVYELPVGRGRSDAAPRGDRGNGGANGDGGDAAGSEPVSPSGDTAAEDSLYRSENNFGTSSKVPGDPGAKAIRAPDPAAPRDTSRSSAADVGDTSETGAIILIALLAAGGIGIGLIARRNWF